MPTDSPLEALFEADRVAIIGASERNHYAATIFRNLQKLGFDISQIVPVNPNRAEVFGLKAYPSLLDVPGKIPLAVVATNCLNSASGGSPQTGRRVSDDIRWRLHAPVRHERAGRDPIA